MSEVKPKEKEGEVTENPPKTGQTQYKATRIVKIFLNCNFYRLNVF